MVSSDASDDAESTSGGEQASQPQETPPCTQAEAPLTRGGDQRRRSSSSSSSSNPLANSEDCSLSTASVCDRSRDESCHDQITRSSESERTSRSSQSSSTSLHPESCCLSPTGRPGSIGVVNLRNTPSRTGLSPVEFTHLREGDKDEGALQWMQALEFQGMGACRTDERLRPSLRWNVSCGGDDSQLLAHLGQHFKARELAMLARCLCAPLVSIRVGKVSRCGRLLHPTATRGYLILRMFLSSEMRLCFVTDAGLTERISVISSGLETSGVTLEYLSADPSGRSFVLKSPGHKLSFFWQSESCKAVGDEMVCKMKDLLKRQPSLAQLTGIHETRLDRFARYLRSAVISTSESTSDIGQLSVTVAVPISSSNPTNLSQVLIPPALTSNPPAFNQPPPQCNNLRTLSPQFVGAQLPGFATSSAWPQGTTSTTAHGLETGFSTRGASVGSSTQFLEPLRESQQWCMNYSTCSGVASLTSPLRVLNSNNQGFETSNALGGRFNAMWSTQTSFSEERTQVSSHSAGLCTALQSAFPSNQHESLEWHPERKMMVTHLLSSIPVPSLPETLYPFTSMVGVPASSSFLPFPLTQVPIATSSLFSPYYCPCPLGTAALHYTYAPPFLPTKVGDVGCVISANPFFSVHPTPALVPPSSHMTSLPLVSAAIPLNTLSFPSFFAKPVSHVPLLNIHVSKQNYLVQSTATAAVCMTSRSPLLPEYLPHGQFPHVVAHGLGGEASLRSGLSPSWEALVPAALGSLPVDPAVSLSCITGVTDRMAMEGGYIDGINVSCNPGIASLDIGSGRVESSLENATYLDLSSQQSRPVLGIVPTVVNRTHVFTFCPDLVTKASGAVQGGLTVLIDNTSELGGSWSTVTPISRGVHSSQVISCGPTCTILHPLGPKSTTDSTSLCVHTRNAEEKPK